MSLLAPLGALAALTLPAILALYFLRIRRPDVRVSSTLLWRRAVRDRQASVPWQRLRPSWLLFLQLLAATLLVGALARPAFASAPRLAAHTVVILDASATMQATDVSPSRFAVARDRAASLVGQMGPADRLTLVVMDAQPRIAADSTGDQGPLRAALDALRPSSGAADLQDALTLASGAARGGPDTRLVILSDGITQPLRAPLVLPFEVSYQPVGASAEDVAVTALTVTPSASASQATVHVTNGGRQRHQVSVEVRADGRLVDARPVDLEPAGGRDLVFTVPAGTDHVTATVTPHDALTLDDVATAVVRTPRTFQVMLVTQQNTFLQRALALRSDLRVTTETPAQYRPDPAVDLFVFDGFLPPALPAQPFLAVGPPADARLGSGALVSPGPPRPAAPGDPLLADVDLSGVHVAATRDLRTSTFGRAVIDSPGGPLLLMHDSDPRAAVLGFDVHNSDLPLRDAFPLLVQHLTDFLLPEAMPPASHEPGLPVAVSTTSGARSVAVTRPDGRTETLALHGTTAIDTDTDQTGLYRVAVTPATGAVQRSEFAVNAADVAGGGIAPRPSLALAGTAVARPAAAPGSTEVWTWLTLVALAVLAGEWVVFHRGA